MPASFLMRRRRLLAAGLIAGALSPAHALIPRHLPSQRSAALPPGMQLDQTQSRIVRLWMAKIIQSQFKQANPRWQQRDCAGLVRFAVAESLRSHDAAWRRANGLLQEKLPPDPQLSMQQAALRHQWRLADGRQSSWVGALELVQENTVFAGRDWRRAQLADLFLYDQGDAQHLMVWMDGYLAYHTGSNTGSGNQARAKDDGLRSVPLRKLLSWQDTRWRPAPDNPNFAGVYRLQFLSAT
ncbi:DUF1175 family protein [Massilia sp. W12]|uniref:DUF1175 family protein n=1 Tax=Massilia sp. W12 TaxID=3126507 RepID=UPI0030CFA9E0